VAEGSGGRGLLDTSVVIGSEEVDMALLPAEVAISSLTLAELTVGPFTARGDLTCIRRQNRLQRFELGVAAFPFDSRCARSYGQIYVATASAGRKPRGSRIVDLMIAATALAHDLPLYTLNRRDLRGLEDLIEIVDISGRSVT
jgi:predicted nucleic acid-binding protein